MGKIAFVFTGQGTQYPGMGADLYDAYPEVRRIFDRADELRPGTVDTCFNGPKEALSLTYNTQPCLFTLDYACAEVLRIHGITPDACAGFSLGEVAAVGFCGLLDFDEAFRMVCRRAEFMQHCAEENPGLMYAIVKLGADDVKKLCASIKQTYPVNFNSPLQTVVACAAESESELLSAVKQAGGRAIKLNVSGAFHSPFMARASENMSLLTSGMTFRAPAIPLYSNATAAPYGDGEAAELLSRQISSPVQWTRTIENLCAAGFDTFIECGPGKALCGLIQKTAETVCAFPAGTCDDLNKLLSMKAEGAL